MAALLPITDSSRRLWSTIAEQPLTLGTGHVPAHRFRNMDSMNTNNATWLQLFVDAMTERDPYKRLALIRELRRVPRESEVDALAGVRHEQGPRRKRPRSGKIKIKSAGRR